MDRYAYYVCFKCKKAYYGGEVRCEEQAAQADDYDPSELVCGACSDVSRAQVCSHALLSIKITLETSLVQLAQTIKTVKGD